MAGIKTRFNRIFNIGQKYHIIPKTIKFAVNYLINICWF
ncbi:hypothetical protein PoMZ_13490 [Pyricularia oryzae]|uniref:Uncharacterized protein n=1 Tax=Pyricularia oryzae TaxID=318829 RepID=A0A4P7NVF6_PYROR|nr:hypothetical protein PoMZ_13490 [Pyricularia oryzae]